MGAFAKEPRALAHKHVRPLLRLSRPLSHVLVLITTGRTVLRVSGKFSAPDKENERKIVFIGRGGCLGDWFDEAGSETTLGV